MIAVEKWKNQKMKISNKKIHLSTVELINKDDFGPFGSKNVFLKNIRNASAISLDKSFYDCLRNAILLPSLFI